MKLKTGDKVKVIAGKEKGKESTITKVLRAENKVVLDGLNISKKHKKGFSGQKGEILEIAMPIDASNVSLVDPKGGVTRIGYEVAKDGKKIRVARKSKTVLK